MKAKKLVALIMSAAMVVGSASIFAACKKDDEPGNTPGNNPGEIVNPGTPENPGTDTPTFINDDNTYYAVGFSNGDGTLSASNWNDKSADIPFDKSEVEDANIFTLTLKMYAGDAFKILFNTELGWSGDVVNYYTLTEEARTYFETNNDSNIICKEGYDGIYTFTLTTDLTKAIVGQYEERYVISVTQDETITPLPVYYKMQVKGGANVNLEEKDGVWTGVFDIAKSVMFFDINGDDVAYADQGKEGSYGAVYIVNAGNQYTDNIEFCDEDWPSVEIDYDGMHTVNLLGAGKYTVTFTEGQDGAGTVKIEKITDLWRVVVDDDDTDANLNLTLSSGVWTLKRLKIEEETEVQLKNIYDDEADTIDLGKLSVGDYFIQYNPAAETDEEKVVCVRYAYYVVGTYTDPQWGDGLKAGVAVKLEYVDEGDNYIHYSGEVELKAGQAIKLAYGVPVLLDTDSYTWSGGDDRGIAEDGTYVIEVWTNNVDGFTVNLKPVDSGSEGEDVAE